MVTTSITFKICNYKAQNKILNQLRILEKKYKGRREVNNETPMVNFFDVFSFSEWYYKVYHLLLDLRVNLNGLELSILRGYFHNKQELNQQKIRSTQEIDLKIKRINSFLITFERISRPYLSYLELPKIEKVKSKLFADLIRSLEPIKRGEKTPGIGGSVYDENLQFKITAILRPTYMSLMQISECIGNYCSFYHTETIKRIHSKFVDDIKESRDVFSIGHFGTAVFLVGKCLEKVTAEYLTALKKKDKITLSSEALKTMKFHDKIGFLKAQKLISEGQWSKLMSIKWDRNLFAHPKTKKDISEAKRDAKAIIIIAINQINLFCEKMRTAKGSHA